MKPNEIAVLTVRDSNYDAVADLTIPVIRRYCEIHGYDFIDIYNPKIERSIVWDRVKQILAALIINSSVVYMDSDVLITNHHRKLEDFLAIGDIVVARDKWGINDGVLLVNDCEGSRYLLYEAWRQFLEGATSAQDALERLFASCDTARRVISVVNQKLFNSYLYSEYIVVESQPKSWQPGDFVLHLPGLGNERRVEIIKEKSPLIVWNNT